MRTLYITLLIILLMAFIIPLHASLAVSPSSPLYTHFRPICSVMPTLYTGVVNGWCILMVHHQFRFLSLTGSMALLRIAFVHILSGITCIGCIRIDFFLHGILSAMVLSVSPHLLLADDARYGYRFPSTLHSWYLPHSSILFRFHLCQGREIYQTCQHT